MNFVFCCFRKHFCMNLFAKYSASFYRFYVYKFVELRRSSTLVRPSNQIPGLIFYLFIWFRFSVPVFHAREDMNRTWKSVSNLGFRPKRKLNLKSEEKDEMKNKTFERKFDLSCDEELVSHLISMPCQSHSLRAQAVGWKVKFLKCKCRWISVTKNLQNHWRVSANHLLFVFLCVASNIVLNALGSHEYIRHLHSPNRLIGDYWKEKMISIFERKSRQDVSFVEFDGIGKHAETRKITKLCVIPAIRRQISSASDSIHEFSEKSSAYLSKLWQVVHISLHFLEQKKRQRKTRRIKGRNKYTFDWRCRRRAGNNNLCSNQC